MNNLIEFGNSGGMYGHAGTFDFMQNAYRQTIDSLASGYGNKLIIVGATESAGNVSDGWLVFNGELVPLVGGAKLPYIVLETVVSKEQYADGLQKDTYFVKRFVFTAVASGAISWADFQRIPFSTDGTLQSALNSIKDVFSLCMSENAVIINGCEVSSINTSASTLKIAAGAAFIDGLLLEISAYSGAYPVWLDSSGIWVNSAPSGTSIKFSNYDTSQRYEDVQRRRIYRPGHCWFSLDPNDVNYFDLSTGLAIPDGKWAGWQISSEVQSRTLVGYDNRVNPADDAYDSVYNTVGHKNTNLKNVFTLLRTYLPKINFNNKDATTTNVSDGDFVLLKKSETGDATTATGFDSINSGTEPNLKEVFEIPNFGDGTPMPIRSPFTVILVLKRV
jgi:hypothetical protein